MGTGDPRSAAVIARAYSLQNSVEAGALTREEAVESVIGEFGTDPRALREALRRCSVHPGQEPALGLIRDAAARVSPDGP
jgi:hypothetical protein